MTAYVFAAGLFLCAVLACVYVLLDGEARFRRASRPDPVPDAVDERWRELNALDLTGRATPAPPVPIPTDEAVRNAGQLPLTWRQRRDLDDKYARITNCPEAIR